jgi:luciferase family oxidoreductase group 1
VTPTALSVLDQGPVTVERGPRAVLSDAAALARHVEDLGYHRYWVAEHHATPGMGISAPEIVIGHLAAATTRLRIGAGGMMLPNHSPLHLVEQFRTLEALHPGRIDLGIGRSYGTTVPAAVTALARTGLDQAAFTEGIREILSLGSASPPPGSAVPVAPEEIPLPPLFLLGSSVASARAAAEFSVGYAFLAAYQDPAVAVEALRAYRDAFRRQAGRGPRALLALTVVVGKDDNHAEFLAQPWRLALARHALGRGERLPSSAALADRPLSADERQVQQRLPLSDRRAEIVGDSHRVADQLHQLIEQAGADEILAVTNIPDTDERHRSYERLAAAMAS